MGDLKNRVRFTSTIDFELQDRLRKLSDRTMIPQSKLIDKAIKLLLKEYDAVEENPDD